MLCLIGNILGNQVSFVAVMVLSSENGRQFASLEVIPSLVERKCILQWAFIRRCDFRIDANYMYSVFPHFILLPWPDILPAFKAVNLAYAVPIYTWPLNSLQMIIKITHRKGKLLGPICHVHLVCRDTELKHCITITSLHRLWPGLLFSHYSSCVCYFYMWVVGPTV